MKRAHCIGLLALWYAAFVAASPTNGEPKIKVPQRGASVEAFVPQGFRILHSKTADFNRDGLDDVVMVVEREDDEHAMPRPLLVLFRERGGGYRLSLRSNSMIGDRAGGGVLSDYFDEIEIRGHTFVVKQGGGSSSRSGDKSQFRFQGGGWYLIGEQKWTIRATWDGPQHSLECRGAKLAPQEVCIAHIVDTNFVTGDQIESWHIEGDVARIVERHRKVKAGAGRVVSDSR